MSLNWLLNIQNQIDSDAQIVESIKAQVRVLSKCIRSNITQLHFHLFSLSSPPPTIPMTTTSGEIQIPQTENCLLQFVPDFNAIHDQWQALISLIPNLDTHFYKYNGLWSNEAQLTCYLVLAHVYFNHGRLATPQEIEIYSKIPLNFPEEKQGFKFLIEDFLHASINVIHDVTRFATQAVIHERYSIPLKVAKFVQTVYSGFQLLNLKNDGLRKHVDSIKYQVKKLEDIIYDLSVRKLVNVKSLDAPNYED